MYALRSGQFKTDSIPIRVSQLLYRERSRETSSCGRSCGQCWWRCAFREAQNESQEALKAAEGDFSIGGYPPDVRSLQAIGRIVLRALLPLRAEVSRSAA